MQHSLARLHSLACPRALDCLYKRIVAGFSYYVHVYTDPLGSRLSRELHLAQERERMAASALSDLRYVVNIKPLTMRELNFAIFNARRIFIRMNFCAVPAQRQT